MRQLFRLLVLTVALQAGCVTADTILVLGDSLSAGYGIPPKQGWVSLLEQRLQRQQYDYEVINASISGDTSAGGLARLPKALRQHDPDIVLVELGGNDGLRGLSLKQLRHNLAAIIETSRAAGSEVMLLGIRLPPNYGQRYTQAFQSVYPALAEQYNVPLVPFILEGIGDRSELMQRDGIHPTAEAQPLLLNNIWPTLQSLLQTPDSQRTAARAETPG